MDKEIKSDTWIWVVVQNPGANEQFLGQLDEVQAICFGELAKDAVKNNFMIFMLTGNGEIIKKLAP